MGLPPTSFFTDKEPSAGWSREDKKLAMAWTILNKETCTKCGQPIWICRSSNKNLQFKTQKALCYATAEQEKSAKKPAFKSLKPGEYLYVVPYMRPDGPLPSRKEYLAELSEE